jgi:hypothetical protein
MRLPILYLIICILGGFVAQYKKDYFIRGFGLCMITGIFGLIAMILSPESRGKIADHDDRHNWPKYGGYALAATLITIFLTFLILILL